jgi:DNA-binding transcriptional LysR family regulator
MKTLEERVGSRIVYREASGTKLTTSGEVLVTHSRKVLHEMEALKAELMHFSREMRGQVRVYANTTAVTEFLPQITREFLSLHPQVNVDIHERQNGDIARAVIDGGADFGVVAGEIALNGVKAIHFATDRLVLVVSSSHPLARSKQVPFTATLPYHHVLLREGSTLHEFLARTAAASGTVLKVRTQVQSFESLARMAEADVGIAILPESAAKRHARTMRVALVGISEAWAVRKRYVLVREHGSLPNYTQEFIRLICDSGAAMQ